MEELIEVRYEEVFNNTSIQIENLLHMNDLSTDDDFERKLEALYVTQGNDVHGRGALYDAMLDAEIAAYETAYIQFKKSKAA